MEVLILGGSSSLGGAIDAELKSRGHTTIICSRQSQHKYQFDAREPESVFKVVSEVIEQNPGVNALVYLPAITVNKIIHKTTLQEWREVFDINFFSATRAVSAIIPHFIKNKAGVIQLISSSAGCSGQLGAASYAASKAAVINFVKSAALEYSKYGINIHTVSPGYFLGGMISNFSSDKIDAIKKKIPANYIPLSSEIGRFCVDNLTGCSYVTGSNLVINGGMQ